MPLQLHLARQQADAQLRRVQQLQVLPCRPGSGDQVSGGQVTQVVVEEPGGEPLQHGEASPLSHGARPYSGVDTQ